MNTIIPAKKLNDSSSFLNIKFSYLYRDGGNYKQFNSVIFSNPNNRTLIEIDTSIKENLIEEQWFVAKHWNVPDMHFKEYAWNPSIDHDWHEFDCIVETNEEVTETLSIDEFVLLILDNKVKR